MSDEISTYAQEFISFMGTCMFFYQNHLSPRQQSSTMYDVGMMFRDYLSPNNRKKLISVLQHGTILNSSDVNAVREAYHTGQTHAVLRDYKDFREDPEMGGETDGKDDI